MKNELLHIYQMGFWRAFWITMRPYLTFVSGTAGLVGLAFIQEPQLLYTTIAFLVLFLSYGLGQTLTDCFQTDTDSLSAPYRPLIQGIISRKNVLIVSLAGLLSGVVVLASLTPLILLPALLAVVGLLIYTYFKRTWWGGPPWNAWIAALLPVIARMTDKNFALSSWNFSEGQVHIFWMAVAVMFFGYMNFVVMGYFKDISADRATGYRTFPVVFGWTAAAIYSDLLAGLTALLMVAVLRNLHFVSPLPWTLFVIAAGINLFAQVKIHLFHDEKQAHGPIANVVRSFILYGLTIVLALKPHWLLLLLLYYTLFEWQVRQRPEVTQV